MCSYNAIQNASGGPAIGACFRGDLINGLLRENWGWTGSMVSDCDAIKTQSFRYSSNESNVAAGIKAGCDQDCGGWYGEYGLQALQAGLVSQDEVTTAVARTLLMRFRLGEFEPDLSSNPYYNTPANSSNSKEATASALRAAQEAMVLLNNSASTLPLKSTLKIALLGPMADATDSLKGAKADYQPEHIVSYQEGLSARFDVTMAKGCDNVACSTTTNFNAALSAAKNADITVMTMGIDNKVEHEGIDRKAVGLPDNQLDLVKQTVAAVGASKVIIVLASGGPLSVDWIKANCPTVLVCCRAFRSFSLSCLVSPC
jgi:beta-glucosidase-like glycosyl hydrolase